MSPRTDTIELTLHLHKMTLGDSGALLVSDDGVEAHAEWLPKSQVFYVPTQLGATIRITMPVWLAEQKGLKGSALPGQKELF